jgi:hypothetical protein
VFLAGCAATLVPPRNPPAPATVHVVDYGRHSSLLVPNGETFDEWTYGEWRWFALADDPWYRTFPMLFWPTQGALGLRRGVSRAEFRKETVFTLEVAGDKVASLAKRLEESFLTGSATRYHYQPLYDAEFVHDPRSFHVFHTCNHVVRKWLRELGVETCGGGFWADYRVTVDG